MGDNRVIATFSRCPFKSVRFSYEQLNCTLYFIILINSFIRAFSIFLTVDRKAANRFAFPEFIRLSETKLAGRYTLSWPGHRKRCGPFAGRARSACLRPQLAPPFPLWRGWSSPLSEHGRRATVLRYGSRTARHSTTAVTAFAIPSFVWSPSLSLPFPQFLYSTYVFSLFRISSVD